MTTPLTPDTILAGTRVLAPFDGWELNNSTAHANKHLFYKGDTPEGELLYDNEFTYHTSYDALRPVFDKFRSLHKTMDLVGFSSPSLNEYYERVARIATAFGYESPEKCFELMVDAVRWFQNVKGGVV